MRKLYIILLTFIFCGCLNISAAEPTDTLEFVYKLHGQTRRFKYQFQPQPDGAVRINWEIVRNLKLWKGSYTLRPEAVEKGTSLSYRMPEDGNHLTRSETETYAMISGLALKSLKSRGKFTYDNVLYHSTGATRQSPWGTLLEVRDEEGAELLILDNESLPIIMQMRNNPVEINWSVKGL